MPKQRAVQAERMPVAVQIIRGANRTLGRVAPAVAARLNQRLFSTPRRFAPRDWETAFEAMGTRVRLASGISLLEAGHGPVVALLHGWEGRATQFAALAPPLVAAGFRVVAVDGPAHGHSRGTRADPYRFAEALHDVSSHVGGLHGVVGHSMGGASISIALAGGLVANGAVIIAAPSSIHEAVHRFAGAMQLSPRATHHFVEGLRAQVRRRGHSDVDVAQLAVSLTTPALVIHARDDREVPFSDSERLTARWRSARLVEVHGAGHRRILRDAMTIAETVAFLRDMRTA
jgi:pimeloyl-ACP methyl ester carboxylesterase